MGERPMGNLTAITAANRPEGRHHDGDGLWLYVRSTGARSWVLRVTREGKRSDIGVGSFPAITLAAARATAIRLRTQVKEGADPLADKRAAKAKREIADERTFEALAATVHGLQRFRTPALSERWIGRLRRFAFPHFGKVAVDKVDGPMVLTALQPIWNAKPETARRVRQLVGKVLAYAHVNGMRGPVPDLADHTKAAFPAHDAATHHPAVDYIHAAARSGETRGATWAEIDLEGAVWRIPAARMKMRRDHAVPLSTPALAILETMSKGRRTTWASWCSPASAHGASRSPI